MSDALSHPREMPRLRRRSRLGGALLETMMAMAVVSVFLTGMYAANARVWSLLRASLESNAANRVVNGRAEQLRASTWDQVTSETYISGNVLSVAPDTGSELGVLTETINVIAYPEPSPVPEPITVTRDYDSGTVTTVDAGDGSMTGQRSIRIDITASWTAKGGAPRSRQISMILSNGGVTGRH